MPKRTVTRELVGETGYQARTLTHPVTFEPMIGVIARGDMRNLARRRRVDYSPTSYGKAF